MNHSFLSHKSLLSVALSASLLAGMTSCQDEDFGYSADQIKYAKNFVERYGEIPADKSWDMSSSAGWVDVVSDVQTTRAEYFATRATGGNASFTVPTGDDSWFEVDKGLVRWLSDQLKEGCDNRYLGSSFVLTVPESDFAIIPIYQGESSIMSELEIKINGHELTKIWTKSDDIQVKRDVSSDWESVGYFSGSSSYTKVEKTTREWTQDDQNMVDESGWEWKPDFTIGQNITVPSYPLHSASTIHDYAVRAKPIIFDRSGNTPTSGAPYMYLSLRNCAKNPVPEMNGYWYHQNDPDAKWVTTNAKLDANGNIITKSWDQEDAWTTVGDRLTSINTGGYMLALNVPSEYRPSADKLRKVLGITDTSINPGCIIVGCEDANGASSDHDNNDVVFLIVGNPAPQIVQTSEVIRKRYMCEDLGGTDDFDFNDVVVDVTQTREIEIATSPSDATNSFFNTGDQITDASSVEIAPITSESVKKTSQTAKIVHVCGTLPLQVRVGNYFFPKIVDPTDQYDTRDRLKADGYTAGDPFTRAKNEVGQGWNPNEEKIIPDNSWIPSENNIKIYVDWSGVGNASDHVSDDFTPSAEDKMFADFTTENFKVVQFPRVGRVPYVIAMDQDVPWMKERESIPQEWITTGNLSNRDQVDASGNSIIAGPGSITYYTNYGSDLSEAVLWSGSIKGAQNITILDLSGETYKSGITEASGKSFNIIKVYTAGDVHVSGSIYEHGRFSLCYKNGSEWTSLFDGTTYPDYFLQDKETATGHVTSVMLTDSQLSLVKNNGLGVISRTNGLEITKVTMYRLWDPVDDIPSADYSATSGLYQKGRELVIKKTTNGSVMVSDRLSEKDGFGKNGDYKILYPYSVNVTGWDHDYHTNNGSMHDQKNYASTVTLTAKADAGYVFDKWADNNSTEKIRIVEIPKTGNVEYQALFTTGTATNFSFENSTEKKLELTLYVNEQKTINFTSLNGTTPYEIGKYDNRIIGVEYDNHNSLVINPVAVGVTTFTIQQPDGHHDNEAYAVSDLLTIKVTVKKLPEASIDLTQAMYYEWSATGNDAYIVEREWDGNVCYGLNKDVTTSNDLRVYGDKWANCFRYVDLPNAKTLVVEVNSGDLEFWFNKVPGSDNSAFTGTKTVISSSSAECTVVKGANGTKIYVVDLQSLRSQQGYVHLNTIAAPMGETVNVKSIKVDNADSEIRDNWDALKNLITEATTALAMSDIYNWNGQDGSAVIIGQTLSDYVWYQTEFTTNGEPICGHKSAHPSHYIDLSSAKTLVVNLSKESDELTFWFNRKSDWSEGKNITANNRDICAVANISAETKSYVINLEALRNSLKINYLHLNGINLKGAKATVKSVYVDNKESRIVNNYKKIQEVSEWTDLGIDSYHQYESYQSHTVKTASGFGEGIALNTSSGNIYGHGSVPNDFFAILDDYSILEVVATEGEPRFLFNRDDKGFIEISPSNNPESLLYVNGNKYYVMLWAIKTYFGDSHAHLNVIKGLNGNATVTSIRVGK